MMTDPTQIRAASYFAIGTAIQRSAGLIINRWVTKAKTDQPSAQRSHHEVLIDHLPAFLAELGRSLAEAGDEESLRHCRLAIVHGDQRWEKGWSIAEVVRDYQLLRLVLVEFLQEDLGRPLHGPEVMALGLAIDDAIGTSVEAYMDGVSEASSAQSERTQSSESSTMPSSELLGVFGVLGHEIRNSLAPLTNSLHILQLAGSDPQVLEKTRRLMDRQVKVMGRLVDDLMDVPRLARGKVSLKMERIDLVSLVRESVDDQASAFKAAGIQVQLALPPFPLWTTGDATRLGQVVGNLFNNAIKFTPRHGKVSVTVVPHPDLGMAQLCVQDDGIGIDGKFLPNVFEAFNQADRSMERSRGGLGLGLALARGLVELHGGRIHVQSDGPGHGSSFVVELPMIDYASRTPEDVDQPNSAPPRALRVLVIDDNRDFAESTRMVLELNHHRVAMAHSAMEGIALAKTFLPEVILCDIGLPEMSGYEVCRQLTEDQTATTAFKIALSGHGSQGSEERAIEAGFDRFLLKPVDPVEVARMIENSAS